MSWFAFESDSSLKRTVPLFLTSKSLTGPAATGESPNWPSSARTYPLELIFPEAVTGAFNSILEPDIFVFELDLPKTVPLSI